MPYTLEEQIKDKEQDIADCELESLEAEKAVEDAIEWWKSRATKRVLLNKELLELLKQK